MPETPAAQRLRLFDLYSRHFSLWEPEYQDIFACPLCERGFCRLSLAGDNPEVNLAHGIPASLGGTFCTLTCSKCNSRGGTDLGATLAGVERRAEEQEARRASRWPAPGRTDTPSP